MITPSKSDDFFRRHMPAFRRAFIWLWAHKQSTASVWLVRATLVLLMVFGTAAAMENEGISDQFFTLQDKLLHFIAFFGYAMLYDFSCKRPTDWLCVAVPVMLFGAYIEVLQMTVSYRTSSWADYIADGIGVLTYLLIRSKLYESMDFSPFDDEQA